MSAPVARTASAVIAFTVPAVPTGMKAGVAIVAMRGVQHAGARGAVGGGNVVESNAALMARVQQTGVAVGVEAVARRRSACA